MDATTVVRPASYSMMYSSPPQVTEPGSRTWITRGATLIIATSEIDGKTVLSRANNPDEYMVYLMGVGATIRAGAETIEAAPESLTIVPPGASSVTTHKPNGKGLLIRVFSNRPQDLASQAENAAIYADGAPEVPPLVNWPDPPNGFRLRNYVVAEHEIPGQRFRLFRSTNIMINLLQPRMAARDTRKLSPHSHDDYEQASIVVEGEYLHHLRYPWGEDMSQWRKDEHLEMGTPSTLIIPANVIHTSRNVNDGSSRHIDIFAPPRPDFSKDPGVLNAKDYPAPTGV